VWIAKPARSRRPVSVYSSPNHSSHHRMRVARGSSAAGQEEQAAGCRACLLVTFDGGIGEGFQLRLDRAHAELGCDRGKDIQRFPRLTQLLCLRDVLQGAHVVQPVRHFDGKDPRVGGRHGGHHLSHCALLVALDLVQCGRSYHQGRYFATEVAVQGNQRVRSVLDRVMQYRCAQHRVIRAVLGQDRGDGQRMRDIRVAALAGLALMPECRHIVGLADASGVSIRSGNAENLTQAG